MKINRPRTTVQRKVALDTAQKMVDETIQENIPFSKNTLNNLKIAQKEYSLLVSNQNSALSKQTGSTKETDDAIDIAVMFERDYLDAILKGIKRKTFDLSVKPLYNLELNRKKLPLINSANLVTFWGENIKDGYDAQVAKGQRVVTFPTMEEVLEKANDVTAKKSLASNFKLEYIKTEIAIREAKKAIDRLILKMWNECETFFNDGNRAEMRQKCKLWGVKYMVIKKK